MVEAAVAELVPSAQESAPAAQTDPAVVSAAAQAALTNDSVVELAVLISQAIVFQRLCHLLRCRCHRFLLRKRVFLCFIHW